VLIRIGAEARFLLPLPHRTKSELRCRRTGLASETKVGERTVAIEVGDHPRHLAAGNVKQGGASRWLHLADVHPTRLVAPAPVVMEDEDTLVVEFPELVRTGAIVLKGSPSMPGPRCQPIARGRGVSQPRLAQTSIVAAALFIV
jgi:hypothetical protein